MSTHFYKQTPIKSSFSKKASEYSNNPSPVNKGVSFSKKRSSLLDSNQTSKVSKQLRFKEDLKASSIDFTGLKSKT